MVWDGNIAMVRFLLDHGADVHATLPDGRTALTIARKRKWIEIEQMLLEQ